MPSHPARQKWHAKLSALQSAAGQARGGGTAGLGAIAKKRSLAGASLDTGMLGVPVVWTSVAAGGLLSSSTCEAGRDVDLWPQDDDSGRQRWLLAEAGAERGEYNVMVYGGRDCEGGCWYLGAAGRKGGRVRLWDADDGSGLQRWTFSQVGDSRYVVALAGGKADDKVFLGADEDGRVRLMASRRGDAARWDAQVVPFCEADDPPPPPADEDDDAESAPENDDEGASRNTQVPRFALERLSWLSARQVDMIMQLVSLPENSTPKWYNNYGYVEFLSDGRGFTTTIFGACSGTGDLLLVLDALAQVPERSAACEELLGFRDALARKRGDDIRGIEGMKPLIQRLGDDPAWQEAVWRAFIDLYWTFALDFADKRGEASGRAGPRIKSVAGRGFVLDTAINHGADMASFEPILDRMRGGGDAEDEVAWLEAFARARRDLLRSGYQELDTSGTGDRCELWLPLFRDNPELVPPIKAHPGYWGKFTLS